MSTYYEIRIDVVLDLNKDKELLNYLKESKRYTDYKNKDKVPFEFNSECIKYQDRYCIDALYNEFVDESDLNFILDTIDITKVKLQCYTGNKNKDNNLERVSEIILKHSNVNSVLVMYDENNYWLKKHCDDDDDWYGNWDIIENAYVPVDDKYNGFYDDSIYILEALFDSYEFHESDIEIYKKVNILEES